MAVMPRASSRGEYEQWFKQADTNNDGFLTAKEVKKMFKSKGYKTSSKVFKQQFSSLDADGDKKVTLAEYLKAMGGVSEDAHRSMCEGSDSSSDDEVVTHLRQGSVKAGPAVYQAWFKEADKNADGFLTAKELKKMFKVRGYKTNSKAFKKVFATLDTDGDKKITLHEYMAAMGQIPDIEHKEALGGPKTDIGHAGSVRAPGAPMVTSGGAAGIGHAGSIRAPGPPVLTPEASREQFTAWFRAADKNNDGFLTSKELKKMFKMRGVKASSKAFKKEFASLDTDGDKKVSLTEYLAAMGHIETQVGPREMMETSTKSDPLAQYRPEGVTSPAMHSSNVAPDPWAAFRPEGVSATPSIPPAAVAPSVVAVVPLVADVAPPVAAVAHPVPVAAVAPPVATMAHPIPATVVVPPVAAVAPPVTAVAPSVGPVTLVVDKKSAKQTTDGKSPSVVIPPPRRYRDSSSDSSSSDGPSPAHAHLHDEYLTPVREAEIRAKFQAADVNGDGFLDLDEMKQVLGQMTTGLTNKQMFDIMHKADLDGKGVINYNEFIVLWMREHGILND